MTEYNYDLFIIGAGSGGVRAARIAAQHGLSVGIAEQRFLGGTCVNVGCVPKKLFVLASQFPSKYYVSESFGWKYTTEPKFSWQVLKENKDKEIERLNQVYDNLLNESGADIMHSEAKFIDQNCLRVGNKNVTAKNIVIASGSKSNQPSFKGNEYVIHSDDLFSMEKLPNKILIVGGGYIAIEFACLLNNLGVNVAIVNRSNQILRGFDREMVDKISHSMTQAGIKIHLDNEISEVSKLNDFYNVKTEKGYIFQVDKILSAIGRSPNTENLDLEKIKVETSKNGAVIINKNYQTSVNNVYALGDVVDRFQLTPVAIHEAMSLVNCLIGSPKQVDYENIPTAVFSTPEFATVGLSEESARKRFRNIEIYVSSFKSLSSSMSKKRDEILLKLIVTKNDQIVRGCHMVGENAAEIIQGFAVALKAGATKQIFDNTVGIHPSTAEEFVTMRSITR